MKNFKERRVIVFLAALAISLSAGTLCYAEIEFRFVCDEKETRGCKPYISQETGKKVFLEKKVELATSDVDKVVVQRNTTIEAPSRIDQDGAEDPVVQLLLIFTPEGKNKAEEVTCRNLRRRLGIVFDGVLMVTPQILEPVVEGEMVVVHPTLYRSKALELAGGQNRDIDAQKNKQWLRGVLKP